MTLALPALLSPSSRTSSHEVLPPLQPLGRLSSVSQRRRPLSAHHQFLPALIWFGAVEHADAETPRVKTIRLCVPEDLREDKGVLELDRLEEQAASSAHEGHYVEAAELLEHALELRRIFLGIGHHESHAASDALVSNCNAWGLRCVRTGRWTPALVLLKKAEAMTEASLVPGLLRRVPLRIATFNNMCCYFRARGKLHAAQQLAERALMLEARHKELEVSPALLNLAVLEGTAGHHEDALKRLEKVCAELRFEAKEVLHVYTEHEDALTPTHKLRQEEVASMLAVAHYNAHIEQLCLGCDEAAAKSLAQALQVARWRLPSTGSLAMKAQHALSALEHRLQHASSSARTSAAGKDGATWEPPPIELRLTMRKVPSALCLKNKTAVCEQSKDPLPGKVPPGSKKTPIAARGLYGNPMPMFQTLPRLQEVSGPIGGPAAQQQAHGVQPLSRQDQDKGQAFMQA
mmetsp:Transcript_125447/g.244322  ORF Transcript_125447/g.244322 Transcript_125447/m.244322 type:complete len:461 (+) Transcript_125447:102-1484(+)